MLDAYRFLLAFDAPGWSRDGKGHRMHRHIT
jgi:hypothetical protein